MTAIRQITAMRLPLLALLFAVAGCGGSGTSTPMADAENGAANGAPAMAADASRGPVADMAGGNGAADIMGAPVDAAPVGDVPAGAGPSGDGPADPATAADGRDPGDRLSEEQVRAQHSPALDACLNSGDAARGVSVAMGGCFHAELKVQDDRLNAAYRSALAKRDAAGQARLRAEERAWIRRRDAECRAVAVGGTIDMVEIPACLLEATIRRRVTLQPMAG
ncbi:lysozyme inhibitor LprI family protein [Sphingomonas colocasiae]|uniref:DUF1311 domain-containing protein n=1 Tax=Sphingomonas colocasiae TaxID=1848973 RepID=A0ABS7PUS5_9SPHN|nr:lysozyme inhibitor LprI family protein [Sphingomonas colocasiae]MBY8825110.1 DUF1311 domain-containing protein [Sphingomonas colocasiae]